MKYLIVFCCLLGCTSCNSNTTPTQNDSSATATQAAAPDQPAFKMDTILSIASKFAEYSPKPGVTFDGNYDLVNEIFVVCEGKFKRRISRDSVTIVERGNCDTAIGDRITLYAAKIDLNGKIIAEDTLREIGGRLSSLEPEAGHYVAVFHKDGIEKKFVLNEKAMKTINSSEKAKAAFIIRQKPLEK